MILIKYPNPLVVISVLFFFTTGCITHSRISTSSGIDKDILINIPDSSKAVIVSKNDIRADSLHSDVINILINRGHTIKVNDTVGNYIYTNQKTLGLSTVQRMKIVTVDNLGHSILTITAEWRGEMDVHSVDQAWTFIPIETDWEEAKWGLDMAGVAFAECVAVASEIQNGVISYK